MKRVLKIILILIAAFALALLVIWLIGRNKSQKAGQNPLSFKQFLGLSTKTNSGQTIPGETSSTFTGNGSNDANGNSSGTGANNGNGTDLNGGGGFGGASDNNPQISNFTNGGMNPSGGNPTGGGNTGSNPTGGNGGNPTGGGNGNGDGPIDNGNPNGTGPGAGDNPGDDGNPNGTTNTDGDQVCSQEDTTIVFTSDELAQLKELQNRFYTIAQTLHTDADVDTEIANHDAFAVKADQVTELYNYCEQKLPLITDPHLQQRVATPFWSTDSDSLSFLYFGSGTILDVAHLTDIHDNNHDLSNNADTSGIKGPYGVLSWSTPKAVSINGSILKTSTTIDPFTGKVITTRAADIQPLVPVIEKILRINLW